MYSLMSSWDEKQGAGIICFPQWQKRTTASFARVVAFATEERLIEAYIRAGNGQEMYRLIGTETPGIWIIIMFSTMAEQGHSFVSQCCRLVAEERLQVVRLSLTYRNHFGLETPQSVYYVLFSR